MEARFDIVAIIIAACLAAYAALAITYVAQYQLEFSIQEIRYAAVLSAVAIAALIAVDFLSEKRSKAK